MEVRLEVKLCAVSLRVLRIYRQEGEGDTRHLE